MEAIVTLPLLAVIFAVYNTIVVFLFRRFRQNLPTWISISAAGLLIPSVLYGLLVWHHHSIMAQAALDPEYWHAHEGGKGFTVVWQLGHLVLILLVFWGIVAALIELRKSAK